jgi:hypothetical protein
MARTQKGIVEMKLEFFKTERLEKGETYGSWLMVIGFGAWKGQDEFASKLDPKPCPCGL